MAGAITAKSKKFRERRQTMAELEAKAADLQRQILQLIAADADNFNALRLALKQKTASDLDYIRSANAPLTIMWLDTRIAYLLLDYLEQTSPGLLSDVGCAAALCKASLEAAELNVLVNARYLRDQGEAKALVGEASDLHQEVFRACDTILTAVLAKLN
jgi:formiminotetrahydrofolate cyclodeaminase